jgi:hypothetical protein
MNRTPDFAVTYKNVIGKESTQAMIEAVEKVKPDHLAEADYHLKGMLYAMQIKTDGTICMRYPANGSTFEIEELQSFVDGSIEYLPFASNCHVFINDEGLPVDDTEGLPLNAKATALIWKWNDDYRKNKIGFHGDVLFVKSVEDE